MPTKKYYELKSELAKTEKLLLDMLYCLSELDNFYEDEVAKLRSYGDRGSIVLIRAKQRKIKRVMWSIEGSSVSK